MRTDDLIQTLSQGLTPVQPGSVERRLAGGIALGGLVTLILVALGLGFRHDLALAVTGFTFWMKFLYTASLAAIAIAATLHTARPDSPPARWLWILVIPVVIVAGLAAAELARTPVGGWGALWLGHSWKVCPFLVFGLSVPIFFGLLWAFRQLAPTRLASAGAAAGLASGASAAAIYSLHCGEPSACFLLTWYSLGIALATLGGALAGPRLLRW